MYKCSNGQQMSISYIASRKHRKHDVNFGQFIKEIFTSIKEIFTTRNICKQNFLSSRICARGNYDSYNRLILKEKT